MRDKSERDRRPLASRDTGWARALARRAASVGLTPNAISLASVGCAAIAAAGLCLAERVQGVPGIAGLLLAMLGIQLRLVCNLIDGMVAIEGGQTSPTGAVWNELPDRLSDVLVLVAAGLLAGSPALGWAASAAAVSTAYVRELGHRLTGSADFGGWMAKPQRMALLTVACGIAIVARLIGGAGDTVIFELALWAVFCGACWVSLVRTRRVLRALRGDP